MSLLVSKLIISFHLMIPLLVFLKTDSGIEIRVCFYCRSLLPVRHFGPAIQRIEAVLGLKYKNNELGIEPVTL